jgi:cytochrome c
MWVPGGIPYVVAALLLLLGRLRQPHTPVQGEERGGRVVLSPQVARTLVFLVVLLTGCGQRSDSVADMTGGHPSRGREAMRKYGCQSCHTIPGVTGTKALVGPPLAGIAERSFIGGVLTNSPENMISWLRDPPAAAPRTAMPNLGVTEKDARDMAAYLYTLR